MLLSLLTCTIFIGAAPTAADEPTGGNDKQENAVLNCDFDFAVVPAAPRPLSRPGLFTFPPTGPGANSACDFLTGVYREKPPPYPFVPLALSTLSFFDADWRFVDNPDYCPDFLEQLKRIRVGDNWLFNTGGQSWMRYQFEYNSRITGINNDYLLFRVRPYADVWYRDQFRFFVEGYFGDSLWHDVPPLGTDVNRADFQNLFVEAKLGEWYSKPVYARVGRQEIQLGSQRLVGTPDWANSRRTFQGARAYRVGESWDVDLFWVQPVFPDSDSLDSGDNNQNFAGAWATYKPKKGTFIDSYYLMLDNTNLLVQTGIVRAPFTAHTIGMRYATDWDESWLLETEGAIQLGSRGPEQIVAGMYSGGVGYHWKNTLWNPTFWAYYNYTSGDDAPNRGNYHTFNQLFPFLQYYMGWVDAVGRQNNLDLNLRCYLYPTNWITLWLQYHHFWLDSASDALYGPNGAAVRRDPTGRSGTDVGQKIELLGNVHLSKRADLYFGYTYFWAGEFLRNTSIADTGNDSSVVYGGLSLRW